jgi:hypothetical protein
MLCNLGRYTELLIKLRNLTRATDCCNLRTTVTLLLRWHSAQRCGTMCVLKDEWKLCHHLIQCLHFAYLSIFRWYQK